MPLWRGFLKIGILLPKFLTVFRQKVCLHSPRGVPPTDPECIWRFRGRPDLGAKLLLCVWAKGLRWLRGAPPADSGCVWRFVGGPPRGEAFAF
jgi:hypothetical protein